MSIRIVQLGVTPRLPDEGPRLGTVQGRAAEDDKQWTAFSRAYRKEMSESAPSQLLDTLAVLSHSSNLSMGCYCDNPARCHRSLLTQLLTERGAAMRGE